MMGPEMESDRYRQDARPERRATPEPPHSTSRAPLAILALVTVVVVLAFSIVSSDDDSEDSSSASPPVATEQAGAPGQAGATGDPGATPSPSTGEVPDVPVVAPLPAAPSKPPTSQLASLSLDVRPTVQLSLTTGLVWNNRLGAYYAISQDGIVTRVDRDLTTTETVLDVRAEVTEYEQGSERGLLGIAFDPRDARMFLYFTDRNNNTNVISMAMVNGVPDPATRRRVLSFEQPGLGHKAGDLLFDPAGNLFIASGDGGGSRGRDAQDTAKLLGKILRIRPNLGAEGYEVPDDNPFVGREGYAPEIWALGLRNPWQISIDPTAGVLYVGDVGESDWEELNAVPANASGINFGWPWYEGSQPFAIGEKPADAQVTQPIHEYPHSEGVAIITGVTYRGNAIEPLRGAFFFADMTGNLYGLGSEGVARINGRAPGVATTILESPDGELLITSLEDGILTVNPS